MPALHSTLLEMSEAIKYLSKRVRKLEANSYRQAAIETVAGRVYSDIPVVHNVSGNWMAIPFNSDYRVSPGMHDVTVNPDRVTFPETGWYLIGGNISFDGNATGIRGLAIIQDGYAYLSVVYTNNLGAGASVDMNINTAVDATAGSYLQLMAYQSSGGNLNILRSPSWSPEFWLVKLY